MILIKNEGHDMQAGDDSGRVAKQKFNIAGNLYFSHEKSSYQPQMEQN